MATSVHSDVASAIGQQVEQMILQAKKDSEARVRHDLTAAKNEVQHMQNLVADLSERVARCVRTNGPKGANASQIVDRASLTSNIAQLEEKWGAEVKAVKQDLHRTILAHNHNSDLMRAHRDALDDARRKLDAVVQPKVADVDAQIDKMDRMLRASLTKQKAVEVLADRLTALEQQCAELLSSSGMGGGFPPMPGLGMGMGLGPPMAQPKRVGSKKGEPPTEEEVRAKLLAAAAKANSADAAGSQFNAQAPVFVPGGAAGPSMLSDDMEEAAADAADTEGGGEEEDSDAGEAPAEGWPSAEDLRPTQ